MGTRFLLCRALSEARSKTKAELSAAGSAVVIFEILYGMRQGIEKENGV